MQRTPGHLQRIHPPAYHQNPVLALAPQLAQAEYQRNVNPAYSVARPYGTPLHYARNDADVLLADEY